VAREFPWQCGNLANCYTLVTYLLTSSYANQVENGEYSTDPLGLGQLDLSTGALAQVVEEVLV